MARKFRGFGGLEGLEASEAWRSRGPEALKDWRPLGLEDMEVFEALHDWRRWWSGGPIVQISVQNSHIVTQCFKQI